MHRGLLHLIWDLQAFALIHYIFALCSQSPTRAVEKIMLNNEYATAEFKMKIYKCQLHEFSKFVKVFRSCSEICAILSFCHSWHSALTAENSNCSFETHKTQNGNTQHKFLALVTQKSPNGMIICHFSFYVSCAFDTSSVLILT